MNLEKYIEHTLLKPDATIKELERFAQEAIEHNFFGICINPVHIKFVKKILSGSSVKLITVIGFPLGANTSFTKAFEASNAVELGADELDMVINIGAVKEHEYKTAQDDIKSVVDAAQDKPVKVIIETDLLKKQEIIEACLISADAGACFVKTSTGFVKEGVGARVDNVKLMHETVQPYGIQVKASGGIRTKEQAIVLINAGASRLGTSSGVNIVSKPA